jgi:hypothetical protein
MVDEVGEVDSRTLGRGAEELEDLLDHEPARCRLYADRRSIAAVSPICRSLDDMCGNRIPVHIGNRRDQMRVGGDFDAEKAILKQVARPTVATIDRIRMAAEKHLHTGRNPTLRSSPDEMNVRRHQAPGKQFPAESVSSVSEPRTKERPVESVANDPAAVVSARDDVMYRAGGNSTNRGGDASTLAADPRCPNLRGALAQIRAPLATVLRGQDLSRTDAA